MSEKYVRDILEKLDEIEKLHAKLRSLVPRVKNYEAENILNIARKGSKNMKNRRSTGKGRNSFEQKQANIDRDSSKLENMFNDSKASVAKLSTLPTYVSNKFSTKYLKKFKNPFINDKWQKLRSDSINFVSKQWHDKNDKIKDFLSSMGERHIILVHRAMQTSDDEHPEAISRKPSVIGKKEFELSSREDRIPEKRRRTVNRLLERLLERFNYSRDSNVVNEDRVSIHDHRLGNNKPRRVQKVLLLPSEEAETLRIISSAERVSVNDNRKFIE